MNATLLELAERWANAAFLSGIAAGSNADDSLKLLQEEEIHREIFEDALRVRTQQHAQALRS